MEIKELILKGVHMSECIICMGDKPQKINKWATVLPLDNFLGPIALELWGAQDAWTIPDIDYYLTKAQSEMNNGIKFEETEFYTIICLLLDSGVKIAMWYDIYYEDLPICTSKEEILSECYTGITDISGMCEVYFMMI